MNMWWYHHNWIKIIILFCFFLYFFFFFFAPLVGKSEKKWTQPLRCTIPLLVIKGKKRDICPPQCYIQSASPHGYERVKKSIEARIFYAPRELSFLSFFPFFFNLLFFLNGDSCWVEFISGIREFFFFPSLFFFSKVA